MMLPSFTRTTPLGEATTHPFCEPYYLADWQKMQSLLDNATLMGIAAMRFIDDTDVRVVITKGATA